MKKLVSLIVLTILLLTGILGCNDNSATLQEFSNGEVSFSVPSDWKEIRYKKDADMAQMIEAFYGAPIRLGEFQPNVNLTVHTLPSPTPGVKELALSAEKAFTQQGAEMGIQDYQRIDFRLTNVDNIEAGLLVSEYTVTKSDVRMKTTQLIVPLDDKVYNLTVTGEVLQWATYEPVFNKIIQSFNIV